MGSRKNLRLGKLMFAETTVDGEDLRDQQEGE